MGFQIFVHSVRMVLRNFEQALKISLVPVAIGIVILVAYGALFMDAGGFDMMALDDAPSGEVPQGFVGGILVFLAVILFIMMWIVVNWHRFVLLEEYPQGWVPPVMIDRMLAYIGNGLILGLIALGLMLPMMFLAAATGGIGILLAVIVWFVVIVSLYRLAIILPASAIGRPLRITEAWKATEGAVGTIIVLLITSAVFQFAIQLLFFVLEFVPIIGPLLVLIPSLLILPLINVSILTTMYGIFVEGRSLD